MEVKLILNKHLKYDCFNQSAKRVWVSEPFPRESACFCNIYTMWWILLFIDRIHYVLIMWFDKSEFTKRLALQETAVSKDPESNQLSFAKLPGVTAAQGPERALPSQAQREASIAGGPRTNAQCHSQVGHQVNRLAAWHCGPGRASMSEVARWYTAAWGRRTWQSC